MISVFGVAVAVAALICTMSVYNGFQKLLGGMYSSFDPQIKIKATEGKTFVPQGKAFNAIKNNRDVDVYSETLEENALVQYKDAQTSAVIKGVSDNFNKLTKIDKLLYSGRFVLREYDFDFATIGVGLAGILGTGNSFIDPITINAPGRLENIDLANPAASFKTTQILLCGTFGINQQDYDNNLVIVPIAFARNLFDYNNEVTAIEIKLKDGVNSADAKDNFKSILGKGYTVQDITEQKADFYRINHIEKLMTFLILSFILLIALFNVIGSLSMLILDKKKDSITLSELGASKKMIKNIFIYQGRLITFSGAILGIIIGSGLCLLQEHFGLLKLGGGGGNYIVDAYPVNLLFKDVLLVFLTALLISIPTTWWPVQSYFKYRTNEEDS